MRPADECRDVNETEWSEFEDHFAQRKIAIGDCMRAYGTNCVREYACEQCELARPDPGANYACNAPTPGCSNRLPKYASVAGAAKSNG